MASGKCRPKEKSMNLVKMVNRPPFLWSLYTTQLNLMNYIYYI